MLNVIRKIILLMAALLIPLPVGAAGASAGSIVLFAVTELVVVVLISVFFFRKMQNSRRENEKNRYYDRQTGVLNRAGFILRFNNDISDFSRRKYHLVYFVIDSNYLQVYHREADFSDVITAVSDALKRNSRNYEFVGRISESGFAMALCEESEDTAIARVKSILDDLSDVNGIGIKKVNEALKVAACNLGENKQACETVLFNLRRNCTLLLESKECFHYCDFRSMNSVQHEKQEEEKIKKALVRGEFKLYVQFIVDNKTKEITSAEALSRWEDPALGIRLPGSYLETMNETGLVVEFDYYMFDKVCAELAEWKNTAMNNIKLSCNFTRVTISEEDFVEKINEIADKYDFDKGRLIMEITEETLEKNREIALNNMKKCKELGFGIALDDFCSGFTSPINLCDYPIDIVKIDRTVLMNTEKKKGKELFSGLISLAHSLDLKIVCEGVETNEQHDYVSSTPCDYIQGWYFSRAIPVRKGDEFVRNFSA